MILDRIESFKFHFAFIKLTLTDHHSYNLSGNLSTLPIGNKGLYYLENFKALLLAFQQEIVLFMLSNHHLHYT